MKRIGILTFQRAYNCGAIMQAFALQYKVSGLGVEPIVIDYLRSADRERVRFFNKSETHKGFVSRIGICAYRTLKKRRFDNFIKKYIPITDQAYFSKGQLEELDRSNFFDSYIVGSDQVWNPGLTKNSDVYLLSFVGGTHRRNSYAASIGSAQLTNEQISLFKDNLSKFDVVTVREQSSLTKYPFLLDYETQVVLDPTLLLKQEEYSGIKRKRLYKNYAFIW